MTLKEDIAAMKRAMLNTKCSPPTHIHVGSGAAEAIGFPHAGYWVRNKKDEWECMESYE